MRRDDHSFKGVLQGVCVCVCVCLVLCDLNTSTVMRPRTDLGCSSKKETAVIGLLHWGCFVEGLLLFANLNKCVALRHFLTL
jgi:hypothetical protein